MKYRKLGTTDIKVSEISLGCWTLGGLNWVKGRSDGWAEVNEDDAVSAVKRAIDAGVNHFDNADQYGNGKAERMLSKILHRIGVKSEEFIIASKIGHFHGTAAHAYEPAHIRHQCEQSLINLRRDYLDIYYFHHGDFGPNGEYLQGAAETMDQLVKEGKVRVKGQSAYSVADFERSVPIVKPAVLQSWAHALDDQFIRTTSPLQKLMDQYNLSFVAFSPLAQGLLLDKFDPEKPPTFEEGDHRRGSDRFGKEYLLKLKPKMAKLKKRFGETTEALSSIALRYILSHPHVACAIPGFRNERQVACNLAGVDRELSDDDIRFIRETLQ